MASDGAIAHDKKKESLFESFMKTVGITKVGSLLLGFLMTLLVLLSQLATETTTVETLLICIFVLMAAFLVAIFQKVKHPGFGSWGVIGLFFLGAAVGILAYRAREGIADQWAQYKNLGGLSDVIFAGLFVFGVIMAVFVVRVWNKEQDDFMKSVATALGGAAIPPLLGKTIAVDGSKAFAAYFLGFAVSAAVNVIYCARLLANYSNKRSLESRAVLSFLYGSDKAEAVDKQFQKNFEADPNEAKLLLVNAVREYQEKVLREFAKKREEKRQKDREKFDYYQLIAIECGGEGEGAEGSPPESPDRREKVILRKVEEEELSDKMFRVAVSLKWQDDLEYISAPGAYKNSFPYFNSVAGLALIVFKTIVMDRDKNKRFRTGDYPEGLCPAKIEQTRGLDEIDFLSYIAIPVASYLGQPEQTRLGILHVDTRLFAAPRDIFRPTPVPGQEKTFSETLYPAELTEYANNLYAEEDAGVKYLEDMRAVLVPILQLYLKCRQGSV